MPLIYRAASPAELLDVWEAESEGFGWYTVKEVLRRLSKLQPAARARSQGAGGLHEDPRLHEMLQLGQHALIGGSMTTTSRLGRASDDLSATAAALESLGLSEAPVRHATLKSSQSLNLKWPVSEIEQRSFCWCPCAELMLT